MNYDQLSSVPKDRMRMGIGRIVERLIEEERVPMNVAEQNRLAEELAGGLATSPR